MRYREVAAKLRRLGCVEIERRGGGSHRRWANPATKAATVLPDRGPKDLKTGTLRAVIRQLGIDWTAFERA